MTVCHYCTCKLDTHATLHIVQMQSCKMFCMQAVWCKSLTPHSQPTSKTSEQSFNAQIHAYLTGTTVLQKKCTDCICINSDFYTSCRQ